jgi:hypothetical protein
VTVRVNAASASTAFCDSGRRTLHLNRRQDSYGRMDEEVVEEREPSARVGVGEGGLCEGSTLPRSPAPPVLLRACVRLARVR